MAEPLSCEVVEEEGVRLAAEPFALGTRCGDEFAASSPTRLLLLSVFGFSGVSLIVGRAALDPNPGDW